MPGQVLFVEHITRKMVRSQPDDVFVFGDNMQRRGLGGQAAEMRGEPNTIGVPTKWSPARTPNAYFTDAVLHNPFVMEEITQAFMLMKASLRDGRTVILPADGLGTGRADLPNRAPNVHRWIELLITSLPL